MAPRLAETRTVTGYVVLCLTILTLTTAGISADAPSPTPAPAAESMPGGPPVAVVLDPTPRHMRVPPPPRSRAEGVTSATLIVNYLAAGSSQHGYTCLAWPANVKTAFNFAADIWEGQINSAVPIEIDACWADLGGGGLLGLGGALGSWRNFTGAPSWETWYPSSLANALSGTDQDSGTSEIAVTYNSTATWYLGTDGNPGASEIDFASVVLHEICHGLGFSGSMTVDNGTGNVECKNVAGEGCWGRGTGNPFAYDRFTENGSNQSLLNIVQFPNPSIALGNQLKSGNIFFDGAKASAAYGGPVPLYAPATWAQGSSFSHLALLFDGTGNALMTPSIAYDESVHTPGPVTMGILQDIGWRTPDFTARAYLPLVTQGTTSWETLLSDGFEGSFPGVWTVFDNNGPSSGEYYWKKRNCRADAGTYSAWAVGGGANGSGLACGGNYPNNADSWMAYGPFSLTSRTKAELTYRRWFSTEASFDKVCHLASTDGTNFSGSCISGTSSGWATVTWDLAAYLNQSKVWIAFVFQSDSSTVMPAGAYVDEVVLRAAPAGGGGSAPEEGVVMGRQEGEPVSFRELTGRAPEPDR